MPDQPRTESTIRFVPWQGPLTTRPTHDARSPYVERCWLPLLGPSTLLLLRFAVEALDGASDGATFAAADAAGALGLPGRNGDLAPFRRVLSRAIDFHTMRRLPTGALGVRCRLPELSPRQLERATTLVRSAHDEHRIIDSDLDQTAEHALRLARALASLGETPAEIERQLRKWRFEPTTAVRSAERAGSPGCGGDRGAAPTARPAYRPGATPVGARPR